MPRSSKKTPRTKRSTTPAVHRRVVVVGGGVMGCAAAFELAKAGHEVEVLERSLPGAEASSAAAGILGAQAESHHPGPLFELCLRSRALYPAFVGELERITGVALGYRRSGVLKVAFEGARLARLERERRFQRAARQSMERLALRALRAREPALSEELAGGLWFEDDAVIEPRSLLTALRIAAEKSGAKFRTGALVGGVAVEGERATGVRLDDGSVVEGDRVVIAAGSWTSLVKGAPAGPKVVPARGQIVEVATPVPVLDSVVFGPECYLVPRSDGRLLIGSTLEFVGYRREVTAGAVSRLLAAALRLVPELERAELRQTWSSFRPYTADELPLLGASELPGLVLMSGHYRNGILLAPVSAEIVRACVEGRPPPLDLAPFRPDRPVL